LAGVHAGRRAFKSVRRSLSTAFERFQAGAVEAGMLEGDVVRLIGKYAKDPARGEWGGSWFGEGIPESRFRAAAMAYRAADPPSDAVLLLERWGLRPGGHGAMLVTVSGIYARISGPAGDEMRFLHLDRVRSAEAVSDGTPAVAINGGFYRVELPGIVLPARAMAANLMADLAEIRREAVRERYFGGGRVPSEGEVLERLAEICSGSASIHIGPGIPRGLYGYVGPTISPVVGPEEVVFFLADCDWTRLFFRDGPMAGIVATRDAAFAKGLSGVSRIVAFSDSGPVFAAAVDPSGAWVSLFAGEVELARFVCRYGIGPDAESGALALSFLAECRAAAGASPQSRAPVPPGGYPFRELPDEAGITASLRGMLGGLRGFHVAPDIPEAMLDRALEAFAPGVWPEDVLFFVESGEGRNPKGALVCTRETVFMRETGARGLGRFASLTPPAPYAASRDGAILFGDRELGRLEPLPPELVLGGAKTARAQSKAEAAVGASLAAEALRYLAAANARAAAAAETPARQDLGGAGETGTAALLSAFPDPLPAILSCVTGAQLAPCIDERTSDRAVELFGQGLKEPDIVLAVDLDDPRDLERQAEARSTDDPEISGRLDYFEFLKRMAREFQELEGWPGEPEDPKGPGDPQDLEDPGPGLRLVATVEEALFLTGKGERRVPLVGPVPAFAARGRHVCLGGERLIRMEDEDDAERTVEALEILAYRARQAEGAAGGGGGG
jgi:hypothetical protein